MSFNPIGGFVKAKASALTAGVAGVSLVPKCHFTAIKLSVEQG
jgi:hypothetical protein